MVTFSVSFMFHSSSRQGKMGARPSCHIGRAKRYLYECMDLYFDIAGYCHWMKLILVQGNKGCLQGQVAIYWQKARRYWFEFRYCQLMAISHWLKLSDIDIDSRQRKMRARQSVTNTIYSNIQIFEYFRSKYLFGYSFVSKF